MYDPTLPLVDLHRHLEGAVRLKTILDLSRQLNLPLPDRDLDSLRPYVQVTARQPGVMAFIERIVRVAGVLVDYDACRRIACEAVEDCAAEGIDYAEIRFSPWFMAEPHGLNPAGVVEAVCAGITEGREITGLPVGLTGILSRTYGVDTAWKELEALLTRQEEIVALDLAGDEANQPAEWFEPHFHRARQAGWHVTAHAGESAGPESIWQAIDLLGAERIGHGVRALEDPLLLDALRQREIGIEANLTSNVQTSTVPDYAHHPVARMLEHGLLVSLNSDDPAISGIDLAYEYRVAAPAAGLAPDQIRRLQENGLRTAFLSNEEKEALRAGKRSA